MPKNLDPNPNKLFPGFDPPTENWSKLPHAFIEVLPLVEGEAELKVILYILRHTWGFQQETRQMSIDEIARGRKYGRAKREETGKERMDSGTGLSENAVRQGIQRGIGHGFLQVIEDARDKARIKRYYSLRYRGSKFEALPESGVQTLNPWVPKSAPPDSKSEARSKKETLETNSESEDTNALTLWAEVLVILELQLTQATFDTWLGRTQIVGYADHVLVIQVHNAQAADWLSHRMQDLVNRIATECARRPMHVKFIASSQKIGETSEVLTRSTLIETSCKDFGSLTPRIIETIQSIPPKEQDRFVSQPSGSHAGSREL